MLINRRIVFDAKPSAGGKLYIKEKENSKSHKKNKNNIKRGCGGKPGGERIRRSPEDGDDEVILSNGKRLRDCC
jgi:hypothetical protein